MGTLSGCRQLKMNLQKKNYIYANSTTQRCPKEISGINRGLEETDPFIKPEVENLVALSL
jgi:hypothetical protein